MKVFGRRHLSHSVVLVNALFSMSILCCFSCNIRSIEKVQHSPMTMTFSKKAITYGFVNFSVSVPRNWVVKNSVNNFGSDRYEQKCTFVEPEITLRSYQNKLNLNTLFRDYTAGNVKAINGTQRVVISGVSGILFDDGSKIRVVFAWKDKCLFVEARSIYSPSVKQMINKLTFN